MKLSGAVAATSIVVVLTGLVGLVWFELPKGQRPARATPLKTFVRSERGPSARTQPRAAPAVRATPPTAASKPKSAHDASSTATASAVVDLRASAAAEANPAAAELQQESLAATTQAAAFESEATELAQPSVQEEREMPADAGARSSALTLRVRDGDGAPLAGGEVRARWREDGELRELSTRADQSGHAEFHAPLGEGAVLEVRASGFAPASFGPLSSEQCAGAELGVTLERGARLVGAVRNAQSSTPLTVVVWPAGNQGLALAFECKRDERDRFEIDGVWSGPLEVLAMDGAGISAVVSTSGEGAELALELEPTVRRSGEVRDAQGHVLAGARVEAWAAHDGFAVARLCATVSDAQGRFDLPCCSINGLVEVRAEHWAPQWVSCENESTLRVQLTARRNLRVRLSGLEEPAGEWSLSGWGIEDVATRVFDAAQLELHDLAPGPYSLALRGPDGATRHFTYTLPANDDGELELRLR